MDTANPALPASDFASTAEFYARLGFETTYSSEGWMILRRGTAQLEFFPQPDIDPATSSFGCALRLDDLPAFYDVCVAAGIPESARGWPRINPPRIDESGLTIAYLIDPDGTLLHLVQN
jgi:hypothetical protein